jgi:cytoskeletal protein RodZ
VSLRQIADKTKISIGVLEALERNDITRLPGGIFGRAFVRSYAIEVGLDPERTIQAFIEQFPVDSVTAGHPASRPVEDSVAVESQQRMASVFGRLAALSIPIVLLMLYFSNRSTSPPATEEVLRGETPARATDGVATAGARPGPAMPAAAAPGQETSDVQPAPQPELPDRDAPADRLLVGLAATAVCQVSVTVDGQPAFTRELQPGETQVIAVARDLLLVAADAGALKLTLNGLDARPLGAAGEEVTLRMDLTNFTDYLIAP